MVFFVAVAAADLCVTKKKLMSSKYYFQTKQAFFVDESRQSFARLAVGIRWSRQAKTSELLKFPHNQGGLLAGWLAATPGEN